MSLCALAMVPSVSKLRLAATSVDTRPGTTFRISHPNSTKRRSINSSAISWWLPPRSEASSAASSTRRRYFGICAAWYRREGLVVASWGRCRAMASISPVSATTVVYLFRDSNNVIVLSYRSDLKLWIFLPQATWRGATSFRIRRDLCLCHSHVVLLFSSELAVGQSGSSPQL